MTLKIKQQRKQQKKELRNVSVALRVTPTEKKKMLAGAKKAKRTLTDFIVISTTN